MTPGDFLRKARESAGMNQDTLAKRLEISRSTVLEAERDVRVPPLDRLFAWADATGVDRQWLVENVRLTASRRAAFTVVPVGDRR